MNATDPLLKAMGEILYGHMEGAEDGEVAIEPRAWNLAIEHVKHQYPLLANIMDRVAHNGYENKEDALEMDLGMFDAENQLYYFKEEDEQGNG